MIPEDFASRYCKNNLQNLAYLEVPSGKTWEVEVVRSEGQIWLAKGWQEFRDYHSISCGHFLMFHYNGRSHFNVTIFDLSATEIEYPTTDNDSDDSIILEVDPERHITEVSDFTEHSIENIDDRSLGQSSKRKSHDVGVEEDDVLVGTKTNIIQEKESQGEREQPSEIVLSKNEAEGREEIAVNHPESRRRKAEVSDVVERSVENIGDCSFGQASKRRRQDGVEEDDVSVDIQNNVMEEENSQGEHERQSEIVPSKSEAEGGEEIAENYQKAKDFKSNNPFIISIMHPSYISHPFSMSIPKKFAQSYFRKHCNLVLSVTGKGSWPVNCTIQTKNAKFRWKSFVLDNKLKTGDVCVLEVIEGTMPVSINVTIFPAVFSTSMHEIDGEAAAGDVSEIVPSKREVEESAENYQKAKDFKSNNPFIISIIRPSYVSHPFNLSIPKKFAQRYFCKHCNLVLSVAGKGSWSVECTIGKNNAKFNWKAFVLDNKLKTGDVCVMEVIEGTMPVSINVIIFPVSEIAGEAAGGVSDSEHQCSQHISAAYERAKAFTSENPFFIRVMQPSYASGYPLNIPRVIGWEFFPTKRSDLVLQVPNKRSWVVRCCRAKEYAKLTSGWKEFVLDNDVKTGDVCVFEQVIRSNRVFNVYIFPADEDV